MTLDTFTPDERPVRWASLMGPSMHLAQAVADTDFVPRSMRGNPGAIAACFLYGDELGIGPLPEQIRQLVRLEVELLEIRFEVVGDDGVETVAPFLPLRPLHDGGDRLVVSGNPHGSSLPANHGGNSSGPETAP